MHFDLVIVGTGSGNTILDHRFDQWKVAIVERDAFGGTCLNRGCIPSKMFVYPADVIMEMRRLGALDVDAQLVGVRWRDMRDRIFARIDPIASGGQEWRSNQPHVTVFSGDGRFVGDKQLQVTMPNGEVTEITGDRFVLAAGARPVLPDIPGLDEVGVHTSDTIMRIDEVPARLGIIGGGFIAVEQAHVFEAFGADVTMLVRRDRLLSHEDRDVSERITELTAARLDLRTGTQVVAARRVGELVELDVVCRGEQSTLEFDTVLVATGRHPNGDELQVERTGVRLDALGNVVTDPYLRTAADDIFALGDIRSPLQLKHVANHEARVVQHNLLHPDDPLAIDEDAVPHAVFGHPQIASVGATQQELEAEGRPFLVGHRAHGGTAYGWAMEDTEGFVKVLVDPETRLILGGHIIGHQAAILVQVLVQAMRFGQTADEVARGQMWPHPALSEVVENALLALHEEHPVPEAS